RDAGTSTATGCAATGRTSRRCEVAEISTARVSTQTAAGKAQPSVDLILEKVGTHDPIGSQAALRMPNQPEPPDVLVADLVDDGVDDVLQVLVVGLGPGPRRGVRRGDDEAVLIFEIQHREIVALPVPPGAPAGQAQNERGLLVRLQVARVVEEIRATRLQLDHLAGVDDPVAAAILLGTVQDGRRRARRPGELYELLCAGVCREGKSGIHHDQHSDHFRSLQTALFFGVLIRTSAAAAAGPSPTFPRGLDRSPRATRCRCAWSCAGSRHTQAIWEWPDGLDPRLARRRPRRR